jgi:hypothetical protein
VIQRPVVVAVRLSEKEAQIVDERRGALTRSQWLRMMLLDYEKTLPDSLKRP